MTKIVVWVGIILSVALYAQYNDTYSKKCRDAGGTPILTVDKPVCLHPTATLQVE